MHFRKDFWDCDNGQGKKLANGEIKSHVYGKREIQVENFSE